MGSPLPNHEKAVEDELPKNFPRSVRRGRTLAGPPYNLRKPTPQRRTGRRPRRPTVFLKNYPTNCRGRLFWRPENLNTRRSRNLLGRRNRNLIGGPHWGPHRAVARWGKEEKTWRLSVPALRGREVKPVPRRRVRPVRGIIRWAKIKDMGKMFRMPVGRRGRRPVRRLKIDLREFGGCGWGKFSGNSAGRQERRPLQALMKDFAKNRGNISLRTVGAGS